MSVLKIYNTLSRSVEAFRPADTRNVTFYTCGPTVYDDAHVGNFRSFLAADVLRRWIESPMCVIQDASGQVHQGPRTVIHVMNLTDVGHMTDDSSADGAGEDKMEAAGRRLLEAKKTGSLPAGVAASLDPDDPLAIASYYAHRFREDAVGLGLKVAIQAEADPTLMPRATDNIDGMIRLTQRLIERGHAYTVGPEGEQAVYFHVPSFGGYGRLSGNTLDELREGAGGRVQEEGQSDKRHPADFLLWKADPNHLMRWPSPWGEGYPGWHVECSVMAFERLVPAERQRVLSDAPLIDIHSGGEDNIFPHHECERAQSCCAFGQAPDTSAFASLWFHPRHLFIDGRKMAKRSGRFLTPRDLFADGHEPGVVRYELIKTHYRSNANFTEQGLRDSARVVNRWRRFLEKAAGSGGDEAAREAARAGFADAMHDDLNIAGALGAVHSWVGRVSEPTEEDAKLLREFDDVLGVLSLERLEQTTTEIAQFAPGLAPDPRVEGLLVERRTARESRDFTTADRIRDELGAMDLAIRDLPDGRVEVTRRDA